MEAVRARLRVNYLHYGTALAHFEGIHHPMPSSRVRKQVFCDSIVAPAKPPQCATEVVASFGGRNRQTLSPSLFQSDVASSLHMRGKFGALGVRGFSFVLYDGINHFPYRLRQEINLRLALVADPILFYPRAVSQWLRRHRANHVFVYDAPAIAFLLGIARSDGWYILTLQSDVTTYGPAAVRD